MWGTTRFGPLPILLATLLAAGLRPAAASAQVIEIGDDGAVTRHVGPALYMGDSVEPISPRAAGSAARSRAAVRAGPALAAAEVAAAIERAALANGVMPTLAHAVAWHESRLRADVISAKGAIGVMQLMPATARALGVDPWNPLANIEGGVRFLGQLVRRYDGDIARSLAAYNAGPRAVDLYGGVPPFRETRSYVTDIMGKLAPIAH